MPCTVARRVCRPLLPLLLATVLWDGSAFATDRHGSHQRRSHSHFGHSLPWQPHHYGGGSHAHFSYRGHRGFRYGGYRGYGAYGSRLYRPFLHPYAYYGFGHYGLAAGGAIARTPFCGYAPGFYSYYAGPIGFPPVYGDSRQLYGLGPIARLTQPGPAPQAPRPVPRAVEARDQEDLVLVRRPRADERDIRVPVRRANAPTRASAVRLMDIGTAHFAKGDYVAARRRFRDATKQAPDLAEAYLRWAFASIALERYDDALTATTKAIGVDPAITTVNRSVAEMYANEADCTVHRNALAQASLDAPHDANLLFLVAVHLHFSAERDRATPLFESARRLGMPADYVRPFLSEAAPATQPRDF